jgi:hypothetical protein
MLRFQASIAVLRHDSRRIYDYSTIADVRRLLLMAEDGTLELIVPKVLRIVSFDLLSAGGVVAMMAPTQSNG